MSVSAQSGFTHLSQKFQKSRVARQVCSQNQRVDKKTNQPLNFGAGAVGNGRSDNDVRLSRVAIEQRLESRQQGHKQGDAFLAA